MKTPSCAHTRSRLQSDVATRIAHNDPPTRMTDSAASPSISPHVRVPEQTSSRSANSLSAAASRSSRPPNTALASKSICVGKMRNGVGPRADLDRRRDGAAVAVTGSGREQHGLRAGCGEPGHRFRRESRRVHDVHAGRSAAPRPRRARPRSGASRPWRSRPSDFSSIELKPPRMFSAPGLLPVRSKPVAATAGSRRRTAATIASPISVRAARAREQMFGAEPLDGLAEDRGPARVDDPIDHFAGQRIRHQSGRGVGMSAFDREEQCRQRRLLASHARRVACQLPRNARAAYRQLERILMHVIERNGRDRFARGGNRMRDFVGRPVDRRRPQASPRRWDCVRDRLVVRNVLRRSTPILAAPVRRREQQRFR